MWATLDAVRERLPAHVEDPQACETPNEKGAKVCVGCLVVNCYQSSTASQSWHTSDTLELTVWVALLYGGSLSPRSESLYGSSISLGKRCSVAARFHRGSSALWPLAFTGEALLCGRSLSQGKRCSVAARFRFACTITVVLYTCTCAFPSLSVSLFAYVPPLPPSRGRLGTSDVVPLPSPSGISGLSFDSSFLSPLLFFCLVLLLFLSGHFSPDGPFF